MITKVNPKRMVVGLQESEFNMFGYNILTLNIRKSGRRGIIIYIRVGTIASQFEVISNFSECLFIQINLDNYNILIVEAFYRSPTSNANNCNELIALMRKINTVLSDRFILLRDFNLSSINWHDCAATSGSNSLDNK